MIAPYRIDGKPKDWTETENGNYRDTCPSNFWDDITIPFWSMAENTAHPTQKSEKLNRHYIGVEVEAQYCAWAEQRLEMAESDPEIQGYVNGVFWERNSLAEQML